MITDRPLYSISSRRVRVISSIFWACGYSEASSGGQEAQKRPFISGAAWFNDDFEYTDEKGKDRTISVRRGCPFSVGTQSAR